MWSKVGRVTPLRAVEAVYRDYGQAPERPLDKEGQGEGGSAGKPPPLDRRSAESILGRDRVEGAASTATKEFDANGARRPSRNDIETRLAQLEAEKGAREREKASATANKGAEQSAVLSQLKARDGEVRAHEAAHIAAGGRFITGGASYSYQRGPDGASYAIGGEVGIDSSPIPGKPEETLAKMQIVRAAALAPADPSGADLSVAGAAAQAMAEAMSEIADKQAKAASPSASSPPDAVAAQRATEDANPGSGSKIDLVA